ncbi:MAG: ABC transporter permease [Thermoleophilia bacterium]
MIRLVAGREMRERMRTKTFKITTLVLLAAGLAAVVIPVFVGGDGPDRRTIALSAAGAPAELDAALRAGARAQGSELTIRDVDPAAAERLGASGDVDAGVIVLPAPAATRVVVEKELSDGLRAVIVQGLATARVTGALSDAGVPPAQVAEAVTPPALDVRESNPDDFTGGDLAVGYIAAVVLYLALLFSGAILASGVAEEKTSRVSEVLLASLRPVELLLGKVIGIGATTLIQLASAAIPALIAAVALDVAELPATTGPVVAWAVVWFVAGYALYAAVYGALGSLVGRQQEVGQVTGLPAALLLVGYLGATVVPGDPDAGWVQLGSILPPFAPMMMPMRVAAGGVPPAQMALALVLTAASAVAAVWFGARVYRGGIVRTGARTKLRDALRSVTGSG